VALFDGDRLPDCGTKSRQPTTFVSGPAETTLPNNDSSSARSHASTTALMDKHVRLAVCTFCVSQRIGGHKPRDRCPAAGIMLSGRAIVAPGALMKKQGQSQKDT